MDADEKTILGSSKKASSWSKGVSRNKDNHGYRKNSYLVKDVVSLANQERLPPVPGLSYISKLSDLRNYTIAQGHTYKLILRTQFRFVGFGL